MHQLVAEDVVRLRQRAADGKDDPALERLRHAPRALPGRAAQRVGLLELRMTGVEDDRLALLDLVAEDAAEPRVPALAHAADLLGGLAALRVVVDVEVLRLQHLELLPLPLHGVAAEVLRARGRGGAKGGEHGGRNEDEEPWCRTRGAHCFLRYREDPEPTT